MNDAVVGELLKRMKAGVYGVVCDQGGLVLHHKQDGEIAESAGCAIRLNHLLCVANGPTAPPPEVDEPMYDTSQPELNLEMADTNTLIRVLYEQKRPWVLGTLKQAKTTETPALIYGSWWQGDPILCGGLAGAAVHYLVKATLDEWRPDPGKLADLVARTARSDFPAAIYTTAMARVVEAHALYQTDEEIDRGSHD